MYFRKYEFLRGYYYVKTSKLRGIILLLLSPLMDEQFLNYERIIVDKK